jgi:hypothetical protein
MRRAIISIILMFSLIIVTSTTVYAPLMSSSSAGDRVPIHENSKSLAEAGENGNNLPVIQYMDKMITGQLLSIVNSYANTGTHSSSIDLSSYQIPGWTLYKVIIDSDNVTAIAEREVVGTSASPVASTSFEIYEYDINLYYDQLAQGFYNMNHDGQLQNISMCYDSPTYDPANQNYAYFDIRSDYQDGTTNITSSVQLYNVGFTKTWKNVTQTAILDAGNTYYAVLNGSKLVEYSNIYPTIRWYYQDSAETFLTRRHTTDGNTWGSDRPFEALLNYTYIPWNKTSNSAIVYSNPSTINLTLDGAYVTGSSWSKESANNITQLQMATNQSVNIFYNLTLCYKQNVAAGTTWGAEISSMPIAWNATLDLVYPAVSGITGRFMNITSVPLDWTTTGLYLGTSPAGAYTKIGSVVNCSGLSDGTWTLTSTAPNYVTDIALSNASDSLPIGNYVSILMDMDIDATIEDGIGTLITGGTTNLTVLQTGAAIYAPAEIPASGGLASFLWDISSSTSGNGTHSVEVFWTNGTESGYFTKQVFVFYPTDLVADDYIINAFVDNSFVIGVDFNQIFPVRGLDTSLATVRYSFDAEVNVSLTDQGGGRWNKTISTAGLTAGLYPLYIYAEGYALENQSLTIPVYLTHETLPLNWSWSPGNSITYLESTNLTVSYRELGGANIPDATVNVTFDGITYDMKWNSLAGVYWIQLNGSDFAVVPGNTTLTVNAWKSGYAAQYNDTIEISIAAETGVGFDVVWNPTDLNITFIEQITITVNYTYNSVPIDDTWDGVWVRVTFSGYPDVDLTYISGLGVWQITLNGSDYLGTTAVTVRASATGYSPVQDPEVMVVREDIPSLSNSWPSSSFAADYDTDVPLTITVLDSIGSSINDANLTVTVNGTVIPYGPGVYTITISRGGLLPQIRGVYTVNVTMVRYGYTTTTIFLNLTVRATTQISINTVSSEYEQWNITVSVTFSDYKYSTPITGAIVTMTLDGVDYTLVYSGGSYITEILLDLAPGTYTLSVIANAPLANSASGSVQLTVNPKRAVSLELVSEGDPSAVGQPVILRATLRYNDSGVLGNPIVGENVSFIVRITFANGTVVVWDSPSQYDSTNTIGVAQWSFYVPAGNIESIEAEAHYYGSRLLWSAQKTITVGGTSPLMAVLNFFFWTNEGRLVIGSIAVLGIVAAAYNRRVKPKKRAAKLSLENQLQMFVDLESLRHFMAVYLDRGTCVFYHPFTDERIQPDLISGFIAAITSVYGEIKGDGVRGTLEEIQYHGLRLNSYSGDKIIGILILEGEMTPLLKDRLQFFVELFENQYEKDLDGWTGLVDCFDSEWIVSTLNAAFNYAWLLPHRFGPTQKVSKTDAKILDYIAAVRDERGEFFIRKLLTPLSEMLEISEAQVLDRLLTLQDKGAIVPVGVQTVLQRQGMGLSNGQDGDDVVKTELPRVSETKKEVKEKPEPAKEEKPAPIPEKVVEEPTPEPKEKRKSKLKVMAEEPTPEPEPEKEIDPMEAFVRDVESLLVAKEKEESDTEKDEEE